MQDLTAQLAAASEDQMSAIADELIANMRDVVPKDTGALSASLRKKNVSKRWKGAVEVSFLVIGGGPTTTRRGPSGAYDYAVATEFGTKKEAPEPFFYNTYREYSYGGIEQYKETIQETIEMNNQVRALRSENYNNNTIHSTSSVGYRGAVVIQKKAK